MHVPAHLAALDGETLWRQYRANGTLWASWPEDTAAGLSPTLLEAAELVDCLERLGHTVAVNLDVTPRPDTGSKAERLARLLPTYQRFVVELLRGGREFWQTVDAALAQTPVRGAGGLPPTPRSR